jgi:acetyl esterase/lipase
LIFPKVLAGALAPVWALMGLAGALLALFARAPLALPAGLFGLAASARYVWAVAGSAGDFGRAFGPDWRERIPPHRLATMLGGRWSWRPALGRAARVETDIAFWSVPGCDRRLLCDIWQPPAGVARSGLALVYCHGSGWHWSDKDRGTRPMFRHLAGQGHVVMDVAYRLCPEADWRGMQDDVKRAVAWMKANAGRYGVDPRRVVLAGGSAGAHLALLAAYTAGDEGLRPADAGQVDLSVAGIISWYGPTDMLALYHHSGWLARAGDEPPGKGRAGRINELAFDKLGLMPAHWHKELSPRDNLMRAVLGGTPAEAPQAFNQASPISHVGPHCPPTLLLQGADDSIVPAEPARALVATLRAAGVPAVLVEYPQTEHAFDLLLPQLSPPAQAALYETERFLAVLAGC